MIYGGIDIGANGAFCFIDEDNKLEYFAMPKIGNEIDINMICEYFSSIENNITHIVIENLSSIFGSSAKSNFQFGRNNGIIEGILSAYKIPYTKVMPKKWQKEMWEGIKPIEINTGKKNKNGNIKYKIDTKATSLLAAKRLFPNENFLSTERSRVPHDGIVDSCLLGLYCKRNFK